MIEIEINGKKVSAEPGQMIIEVADDAGIYIPRFCYHKKLSIAANCRMCLVEVSNSKKPLPACATPIAADIKVFTQSSMAVDAQRDVMEYLLINHPLDCPICDQGGVCDLQDLAMGYGKSYSYYDEAKRSIFSENIGPLVETEMTRCIHCTRCVRFGDEVAGLRELGVVNRGEDSEIGTYVKHFLKSELSGNIIDLCPVGALTNKPVRYSSRGWELREHASIAPYDCVGSNIYVHSFYQEFQPQRKIMQVVPRQNEAINETWLSDRDRYGFLGYRNSDRIYTPHIKIDGKWQMVTWKEALTAVTEKLAAIINDEGAEQIAALASPSSTSEELYLLQKFMRTLGSNNIDHRLRRHNFADQDHAGAFPGLNQSIEDIETGDAFLLIGTDIRADAPLIGHRINKAVQEGATAFMINPINYRSNFPINQKLIAADILYPVAEVVKALSQLRGENVAALADISVSDAAQKIAENLHHAKNPMIFAGAHAIEHPQLDVLHQLVATLRIKLSVLTPGANSAGAWLAGAVPHRGPAGEKLAQPGLHAKALLTDKSVAAYILLNIEPESDCVYPRAALAALNKAKLVVCATTHASEAMKQYADIILPVTPFTKQSGTYVNAAGTWQSYDAVTEANGQSKPAWKIFNVLANLLNLANFNYTSSESIRDELRARVDAMPKITAQITALTQLPKPKSEIIRIAPWHMYRTDIVLRRTECLQKTIDPMHNAIRMNKKTANKLNVSQCSHVTASQQNSHVTLPLMIDERVPDDAVFIASATEHTKGFGETMAPVTIERGSL